jgi:hypothetical protein
MNTQLDTVKEVLSELFSLLEAQETQSTAILRFLKDQGIATDEKLTPYLEQAGNASSVKWRAARRRMEYLLTPIQKQTEQEEKPSPGKEKPQEKSSAEPGEKPSAKDAASGKDDAEDGNGAHGKTNPGEESAKDSNENTDQEQTASAQSSGAPPQPGQIKGSR